MVVVSSTFSVPAEGVLLQTPGTKLLVNDQELGTATLYITERNVVWGGGVLTSGAAAPTITLFYPTIAMHAVQREPSPSLYLVLNYELRLSELQQGAGDAPAEDDDDNFEGDNDPMTQLRFVPQNENELQQMFSMMSQGQSLNPDPEQEGDDDDPYMDGEDFYEGEEEFEDAEENSTPEDAAARLRQLNLENVNGVHDDDEEEIAED